MPGEDQQRLQSDKDAESQAKAEAILPKHRHRAREELNSKLDSFSVVEVMYHRIHCYIGLLWNA